MEVQQQQPRVGVLVINIGTPNKPNRANVRRFLERFLMDRRVINIPGAARWILVHGIISPFRSGRSSREYRLVWQSEGSPLSVHSQTFARGLQAALGQDYGIHLAMRYSAPDIAETVSKMQKQHYSQIIIMPLYPQNASSTTGSSAEEAFAQIAKWDAVPGLSLVPPFFAEQVFVQPMSEKLQAAGIGRYDAVVFSYHGLPSSHLPACISSCRDGQCTEGNHAASRHCYKRQCLDTTARLIQAAGIPAGMCYSSFQSRMSRRWIGPFTDQQTDQLLASGKKRLLVLCPSFVADCLETLGEIAVHLRNRFLDRGGESFDVLPCLNSDQNWIEGAADLLRKHTHLPND